MTIDNTDSDLKAHELNYADELLVFVRIAFQVYSPNEEKQEPKTGFGYD